MKADFKTCAKREEIQTLDEIQPEMFPNKQYLSGKPVLQLLSNFEDTPPLRYEASK